ncbi:MAG TPA: glycosyltransferase family 2 protein [Zeimonas sp.]|nr:glycosyltransferase family 2 protein [Zeimonas sp.]
MNRAPPPTGLSARPAEPAASRDAAATAGPSSPPRLAIVVPCYNEEAALPETCRQLVALLRHLTDASKVAPGSHLLFVDDGSGDGTWPIVAGFAEQGLPVVGIRLTRNRGHQNALLCGLVHADADVVVSIDADLQDDPEAIEAMLDAHAQGCDIVYGVRSSRDADTGFKRRSAGAFYRLLEAFGVETVPHHADYRLMTRRAIRALSQYREVNLYLRGMIPLLGLRSARVQYRRRARLAGESKYPLSRMLALAWQAITSFSVVPLRVITVLGFLIFAGSLLASAWIVWARFVANEAVPGWASIVLPVSLLGGIQMLGIGVVGEYLGKIYLESKGRPRYLVQDVVAGAGLGPPRAESGDTPGEPR